MGKTITTVLFGLAFVFLALVASPVSAENIAGSSARLIASNNISANVSIQQTNYYKKKAIKKLMEKYNSPMFDSVDTFISVCEKYDLNCYLLPSIAILESTFGNFIYPESHNPFGWGGGLIMFKTWDDSIEAVGKGLRENYVNKGAVSIEEIAHIYSESPTWAPRIRSIQAQFEKEEEKNQLYLDNDGVKL